MKKYAVLFLLPILFCACHVMDNIAAEEEVEQLYFNETMVTIEVGGLGYGYITVTPVSLLESEDIEYYSSNKDVVLLYNTSNNGVIFSGKSVGVAIITATLCGVQTKLAVTVE